MGSHLGFLQSEGLRVIVGDDSAAWSGVAGVCENAIPAILHMGLYTLLPHFGGAAHVYDSVGRRSDSLPLQDHAQWTPLVCWCGRLTVLVKRNREYCADALDLMSLTWDTLSARLPPFSPLCFPCSKHCSRRITVVLPVWHKRTRHSLHG